MNLESAMILGRITSMSTNPYSLNMMKLIWLQMSEKHQSRKRLATTIFSHRGADEWDFVHIGRILKLFNDEA